MSRQFFKIGSFALLAVAIAFGTVAAPKTAGGGGASGQDIPLKATFLAGPFGPFGPADAQYPSMEGKIRNDIDQPYVHQGTKTGQNQILIVQPSNRGHLMMYIYSSAPGNRYLNLHFNKILSYPIEIGTLPTDRECLEPYFIYPDILSPIQTTYFNFYTGMECQRFDRVDDIGPYVDLVPTTKYLNFAKMLPGETKYATSSATLIRFRTTDDPATTNYDESYDYYGLWHEPQFFVVQAFGNQSGVAYWTIKPVAERYKAVDPKDNILKDHDYGSVPRRVTSGISRDCNHGTFMMPFELKIERK